ncbi:carboxypeptidase regulatory-like domain-containing protein [Silvibacterium sp.]|uniref:TonB-dependent receptor n=1 Tax=Silvibacterium sp. TaxID=1964179 RepID=UPI0039E242D0
MFSNFTAPRLMAQAVTGSIVGTATDSTGAVVPNATIVVTDESKGTSQTVTTNASGNYSVFRLVPDSYSIQGTAQGFGPANVGNVAVTAGNTAQINLTFGVAGASQTVTVTAAPAPLQTDSADVQTEFTSQQLQDLPNQNRNFTDFALLTPGVQRASFAIAPTENPQGTQGLEVNGSNYGSLGYYLDGTDNREPVDGIIVINPTLDSLSESNVDTENFPAEFGGALAGFVSAQTKSGSNQFHGDAFLYRRSDALEARDPFTEYQADAVTGAYIPSQMYSEFGGSFGGPFLKDKAFFFMDYQGTRQKVGTSLQENVPTAEVRNTCLDATSTYCDLSQYGGSATTANSLVTSQGRALLSALPAPNVAGTSVTNNYVASGNGNNNGDVADLRLDDQVTKSLHAFGRYDFARFSLLGEPVFGAAGGTGFGLGNTTGTDLVQNQSAAVGFDDAISSSLLTDFRFGFLDYHVSENKIDNGTTPATADGIPNLNTDLYNSSGSPTYNVEDGSISNFGTQGCNCPLTESEQVFQVNNNWTKTWGNHSFRWGADLRYAMNLRDASDYNRAGELTFNDATGAGSGIAAVLEGQIAEFQRFDVYKDSAATHQKRGGFYAQDTWRVTPKLTLNYGVRWDIIFPETVNSPGNGGFTNLQSGYIQVAGYGGFGTNGGEGVDLTNLGGRFGFSYQAKPGTVIRGAVGQVYDDVGFFGTIFGTALAENIPTVTAENVGSTSATTSAYSYSTIPAQTAPWNIPANGLIPLIDGISYDIRPLNKLVLPKVDQFNLSVQQQIDANTTATIAYIGNIGERVYPSETAGFNLNQYRVETAGSDLTQDERRPYYGRYSNIYNGTVETCCSSATLESVEPSARSYYNALQTKVDRRFSHGFQLSANYTWSRAINYNGTYFAIDPHVEKGPSDTNRNNVFVLSGLYELPFGKGKLIGGNSGRLVNEIIGGWQLAGTTTWESGLPFTPTYAECGDDEDVDSNYSSPSTSSDCRPDKVGNGSGVGSFVHSASSFDPAIHGRRIFTPVAPLTSNGSQSGPFLRPAYGTFGNVGRNSLRGPSDYFADASIFKNFEIAKSVKGQFQLQAFNVFNHVPLGVPSAASARCVDCSTAADAGVVTAVDTAISASGQPYMRQLQFGAKIQF